MIFANIVFPDVNKIRFVVVHEKMLGYIMPHDPLTAYILRDKYSEGVGLQSFPLAYNWNRKNNITTFTGYSDSRPATLADFQKFNIDPQPYIDDTKFYELGPK